LTNSKFLKSLSALILTASGLAAQPVQLTPFVGAQLNGAIDYHSHNFNRIDVGSALVYGVAGGVSVSNLVQFEFQWNRSTPDVTGTPANGGPDVHVFRMTTDQYYGNVLFHFGGQESRVRPYILLGGGASHFAPDMPDTSGLTRPAFAVGGGLKYFFTKNVGLRLQMRWLPINMYTTSSNTWCGPVSGCWSMGTEHYLRSIDYSTGLVFRF
jgi:opacity protein-like surface antigen